MLGMHGVGPEATVDSGEGVAKVYMVPTVMAQISATFGSSRGDKASLPTVPKPVPTGEGTHGILAAEFNAAVSPAEEAMMVGLSCLHSLGVKVDWTSLVQPGALAAMFSDDDFLDDGEINGLLEVAFKLALKQDAVLKGTEETAAPFVAAVGDLWRVLQKNGYQRTYFLKPRDDDFGGHTIFPVNTAGRIFKLLYVHAMSRRHECVLLDADGHVNQKLDKYIDELDKDGGVAGGGAAPSPAAVAAAVTDAVGPLKAQIQQQQEQLSQIRALLEQLAARGPAAAGGGGM
jgi:hypothetical protein